MSEPASDDQTPDEQGANAPSRPPAVPAEPPPIRASDAEREQVAEVVRTAVADGRLTMVEGDERQRDAYAAIFRRDLAPITADLQPIDARRPGAGHRLLDAAAARAARPTLVDDLGRRAVRRRRSAASGRPGLTHRVFAFWGGAELSFRDARLDDAGPRDRRHRDHGRRHLDLRGVPAGVEVTIQAVAIMGGIDVTVDPDTTVIEDGFGFMGGFEDGSGVPRRPDGPRVRVTGLALMGGVSVTRKPPSLDGGGDPSALER